ncbi:MAG TPA: LytTR family DNA-binding domain-containing protein [Saprospiraceae bacterium]|nr:response regulator transcription factor [Lewinellaceae bacterium]HQU54007.1 LytTR family DNA-binding domain-containing protein [Saprospiraceae bacterium]HRV84105.1 LytTR family DNA-binding domain-containing protein [Saprospiraceae bacterium]
MMYRALIVDDEELARQLIASYLKRMPTIEVVGSCKNAVEALTILNRQPVDLLFLDIQMPGITGVEMIRTLVDPPAIILTTAYSEYALEGFELDVTDYLLKPFSFERFSRAINKAMVRLNNRNQPSPTIQAESSNHLMVRADHKIHRIPYESILYIKSMQEYVAYYLTSGRIVALGSLKQLEGLLPPHQFLRVHKSYIIAINKVKSLEGNLLHLEDQKIPVGASYRENVLAILFPGSTN